MSEEQFAAARDRLLNAASGNPKLALSVPAQRAVLTLQA